MRLLKTTTIAAATALLFLAAPDLPNAGAAASRSSGCRLQKPQEFLKRSSFVRNGQLSPARHIKAVRYRAERYGSLEGLNLDHLNPVRASEHAVRVRFMGLPISVHEKIAPALSCVERRIRKVCTRRKSDRYTPKALGGFRDANSYRGEEISNHLFGIAVDIDSDRNPCCGCVSPWPDHPACRGDSTTVYERTALPRCWIRAFERYGFYWLGRDPELRDTMHFEFLGNPDRIVVNF